MAAPKSIYVCQNCGSKSPKWQGKCSQCQKWNCLIEETVKPLRKTASASPVVPLTKNIKIPLSRQKTGLQELDRVLGGGLASGSYILLGGPPGIGKSTLVLQMSEGLSRAGKVLYVCSEESVQQTGMRAQRLNISRPNILLFNESSVEHIIEKIKEIQPSFIIIDSIQSVYLSELNSAPGTVSQVRESAQRFMDIAKSTNTCILIIGHVTKDGSLAGPRVLEHIVDAVLSFEGMAHCRILKALKNRFGAANELGIFQMSNTGLKEVKNPSEFLLEERGENALGSAVFTAMEGKRPLLCEIQALALSSFADMPRRTSIGIDLNRLYMILAVLEKNFQIKFSKHDVFLNLAGGVKLTETAGDLAVSAALLSSYYKKPLMMKVCFFGEIGLTGEIRSCPYGIERVREAEKLGFKCIAIPSKKYFSKEDSFKIKIEEIHHITQLKEKFF